MVHLQEGQKLKIKVFNNENIILNDCGGFFHAPAFEEQSLFEDKIDKTASKLVTAHVHSF